MEEKEILEQETLSAEKITEETVEASAAAEEPVQEETAATEEVSEVSSEPSEAASEGSEGAPKEEGKDNGKKSKKKKILNGIILGVQIALVLLAIVICLVVIINPKSDDVSKVGVKLLPVLSNSMNGDQKDSFKKGDLVVATNPKNNGKDLKVGDIVTFKGVVNGKEELITHRIVAVMEIAGENRYQTKGDANGEADSVWRTPSDIKAVYSFHIKGLGSAMTWIRDGYHFIFVIIIPLGVLLIYNIYLVAQIVVEGKMKKAKALAAENAKQAALASIDEEEIKRRAIEEYLRAQAANAQATDGDKGESE